MPLGKGVRYRYKKGTKIRLAFSPSGEVLETKNMTTGATHTRAAFAQARAKTPTRSQGGADDLRYPQLR